MAEDNINNETQVEESEIDILELVSKLWTQRRKLIKWSIWGAVIGLVIAFSIPREYVTSVELAPEMNDQKSTGSLSTLASMAGINMSSSNFADAVYPMLYPDVINSVPFLTSLFNVEVKTSKEDGEMMTVEQFMEDSSAPWWSYIMALPGKAIELLRSSDEEEENHQLDSFQLTKKEDLMVKALSDRITTSVDTKTWVTTISVKMQDPLVSAMLADTVVSRLQKYITLYRTDKARQDLIYAEKLNKEARENYYAAQQTYADYLDRNQGIAFRSAETIKERLANEASLAFNLYNQTAQQVQKAQAKVQETTPAYAVIKPATVPVKPSAPRKAMILIGFTFLAFVSCAAWILFGKPAVQTYKEKMKASQESLKQTEKSEDKE